jgi:hypothetical protein
VGAVTSDGATPELSAGDEVEPSHSNFKEMRCPTSRTH